jgi:hypothetical protein
MGQLPTSKLIYSYTDYDDNSDKKAMQIKGHYKAISITYSADTQDFDKFLPTVNSIVGSFSASN